MYLGRRWWALLVERGEGGRLDVKSGPTRGGVFHLAEECERGEVLRQL
jgi:hypothetical protein